MSRTSPGIYPRKNYCLILFSVCLLISGFLIMKGADISGATSFNKNIFNFSRITIAPVVLLAGYMMMVFAIMSVKNVKTPKHG